MKWLVKLVILRNVIDILIAPFIRASRVVGMWVSRWLIPNREALRRVPKFWRHFTINLVIGIAIAVLVHFAHHTSFVSQTENLAMDSMMFINQGTPRMAHNAEKGELLQFTYIDIDEDSYRSWGEPFHIPRDKLLSLIQFTVNGGAKAIVVDVDLSRASDNDASLLAFLQQYNDQYPPLFLLRSFYPRSKKYTDDKDFLIRPSILDAVAPGKNIHWVHPMFKLSTYDRLVRYWYLLKIGCLNNQAVVIPSFQLLVDAYLRSANGLKDITSQLEELAPNKCADIESAENDLSGKLVYGTKHIELSHGAHQRVGERIIYTLPRPSSSDMELLWRPAYRLIDATNPLSASLVRDRVTIIGESFMDSRDLHQTPLGEMSGAMVILNAIKSLHLFGQIKPPSTILKLVLELGLIILMAWAFARFSNLLGAIVSGTVIVIVLVPVSFYYFKYGLWVDFAVPLLAMQFHQLIAEYEENASIRRKLDNAATD